MKRFVYVKRLHPLPLLDLSVWGCELKDDALIKISPDISWAKCPTQNSEGKPQPYPFILLQSRAEKILRNAVEAAIWVRAAQALSGLSAQRPSSGFQSQASCYCTYWTPEGGRRTQIFAVLICACFSRSLFGWERGLQKHLGNPLPLFCVSRAGKGTAAKWWCIGGLLARNRADLI